MSMIYTNSLRWLRLLSLVSLLALTGVRALAQSPIRIDLAKPLVSTSILPGTYYIVFSNLAPSKKYRFEIDLSNVETPPLALPGPKPNAKDYERNCPTGSALAKDIDALLAETKEENVPALVAHIGQDTLSLNCGDKDNNDLKSYARDVIARTQFSTGNYTVVQGQQIQVSLSRGSDKTETVTFSTGPTGVWLTSYGWAIIPNFFGNDKSYFIQRTDTFRVVQSTNAVLHPRIVPTIFFSWMPHEDELTAWSVGWVGGLGVGFNPTNANLLMGVEATYHWNLMLSTGLAVHDSKKLLAKYEDNPVLPGGVDVTQVTEATLAFDVFLGIAFRFGDNPFAANK